MKVLQITNIISHHQLPLARCLAAALGSDNFRFAATELPSFERIRLGYNSESDESWVLCPATNPRDRVEYQDWWKKADVVLCGNRSIDIFRERINAGKPVFYMSERWWKPPLGRARMLHPRFLRMALDFRALAASPLFHYLAVGGYAADDMRHVAPMPGRVWQWGYFTPEAIGPIRPYIIRSEFNVLWAGRMLKWKKIDTLIRAFACLKEDGNVPQLTLIGYGPCEVPLRRLAADLGIGRNVMFLQSIPAADVRAWMGRSDVYVLPSNGYEGWGAVINEAMSEGCAVVASEVAGAAKTLIRSGENGYLFHVGDWRNLAGILKCLRDQPDQRKKIADAGRRLVTEVWSPRNAAERFLKMCDAILSKNSPPNYATGPMSAATGSQ